VVYRSLAQSYKQTADELTDLTKNVYPNLYVVGGGSQTDYLNQLTAEYTGMNVLAGPTEATAVGNLLIQMIAMGEIPDLKTGRQLIKQSFKIKEFG
jgi:rhamnulokinase